MNNYDDQKNALNGIKTRLSTMPFLLKFEITLTLKKALDKF
jgi:hydrogenase maturation factor HypE